MKLNSGSTMMNGIRTAMAGLLVWLAGSVAWGQVIIITPEPHQRIRPIPVPTVRIAADYKIKSLETQASIRDQVAQIQLAQTFQNTGSTQIEATLCFPIPDEAAISGLTLLVDGKELPGRLMKKEEARRIYEEIVRRNRDPALLEYMGQGLYQTSVFPLPPHTERRVEIRYSQLLKKSDGMVDLVLPLGTAKHSSKPIETLTVNVRIEASQQLKSVYSPTHKLDIDRPDEKHAVCKLTLNNVQSPDDLRILFGTADGPIGINLLSYRPNEKDDGYFLLLASPEVHATEDQKADKTVVLAIDRSGSMSGTKIAQAKEALKFVLRRLRSNDTFNIVAYDSVIETFRPELQRADEETIKAALAFADGLFAGGSTNINGALETSLHMLHDRSRPNYVLFLTDGLPTVGELNELKITQNADAANAVNARLFAFGVGYDVNSRLLDRLTRKLHGLSTYVKPNENIEAQVAALYNKVASPLLMGLKLTFDFDEKRSEYSQPVSRMYPKELSDLFQGEQLVVVGRHKSTGAARATLTGTLAGAERSFSAAVNFVERSTGETNGFVEKLWATRRVGEIIDELDLKGRNQELIDELVQLSIKHGIITPYTSFLADERVNLADRSEHSYRALREVEQKLSVAEGAGGFAQRAAKGGLQAASRPAAANSGRGGGVAFDDADGIRKELATVRVLGQKTFFKKDSGWQESTVTPEQIKDAVKIVQFSPEYFDLAAAHGGTLSRYLVFDEPVLLNLDGKTYQIEPPKE
jgi:Ca-activated chloride channel family protein